MAGTVMTDDKRKALALAVAQIEKSCGKGSIMRLGTDSKVRVEAIPTGPTSHRGTFGHPLGADRYHREGRIASVESGNDPREHPRERGHPFRSPWPDL